MDARVRPWLALAAALAVGACRADARGSSSRPAPLAENAHATFPVETRDDTGRTVTLRAEPRRIVSLLPSHTQTLFALGLGDRVVGVDDYSDDPAETAHLPKLGGLFDGECHVVMGDGSVRRLKKGADEKELKKLIMPADGEVIDLDKITK